MDWTLKISGLPQGWDQPQNWQTHVMKTLQFVFPDVAPSSVVHRYYSTPTLHAAQNTILKDDDGNPIVFRFYVGYKDTLYMANLRLRAQGQKGFHAGQKQEIDVYRRCATEGMTIPHWNLVEADTVGGEVADALQYIKRIIESDSGCNPDNNGGADEPDFAPDTDPAPRNRKPAPVMSWSYNYLTKAAQVEDSGVVGPVRQIRNQRIDLMRQDELFTCGPATVQNLLRILHVEIPSEADLATVMNCTPESGTDPNMIEKYLKQVGVPFRRFDPEQDQLERLLANNYIVLAEYQDYLDTHSAEDIRGAKASHFALVVGYDKGYFYLIDPYHPIDSDRSNPLTKMKRAKFMSHWIALSYDGSHTLRNWGLVVKAPVNR